MLSETYGIMQYMIATRLLYYALIQVSNVETSSEDGKDIIEYEVVGGGGTEFDVVWKYMEQEGIEPTLDYVY